jgi:hypothetical protein
LATLRSRVPRSEIRIVGNVVAIVPSKNQREQVPTLWRPIVHGVGKFVSLSDADYSFTATTRIAILLPTRPLKLHVTWESGGIMRQTIYVACALAFYIAAIVMTCIFFKAADSQVKALVGGGLFFFLALLLLWNDLVRAEKDRPSATAKRSTGTPVALTTGPSSKEIDPRI